MVTTKRSPPAVAAFAVLLLAAGGTPRPAAADAPEAGAAVNVVGENYCIGCALKKAHGAAAQCSVFGHRHALRVEKALDEKGAEIAEIKGRSLSYLENEKSEKLFKGEAFHNERIEVKGRLFAREGVIDVQEVKSP